MSTTANLITHVCNVTGMNSTASSADRALILTWLQQSVYRIAVDAEVVHDTPSTIALTQGTAEYTLSGYLAIDDMTIIDTVNNITGAPVEQITMAEMDVLRQGSQAQGTPYVYAVDYPNIVFYPTPGAGCSYTIKTVIDGPTLADSATNLTFIPEAFQWGVMVTFAIAKAFQYKKQDEWQVYMTEHESDRVSGLPALRRWKSRNAGRQRPGETIRQSFVTSPSQDTGWGG